MDSTKGSTLEKPTQDSFFKTLKKKLVGMKLFENAACVVLSVMSPLMIGYIVAFVAARNEDARNTYLFEPKRETEHGPIKRSADAELRPETNTLVITLEDGNTKTISLSDISGIRVYETTAARTDLHGESYTGKPDSIEMELMLSTRNNRKWWRPFGLSESSPPISLEFRDSEVERGERLIEQLNLAIKQGSIIIDKAELEASAMSSLKERSVRKDIISRLDDANANKGKWNGWWTVKGGAKVHEEMKFRNQTLGVVKQVRVHSGAKH